MQNFLKIYDPATPYKNFSPSFTCLTTCSFDFEYLVHYITIIIWIVTFTVAGQMSQVSVDHSTQDSDTDPRDRSGTQEGSRSRSHSQTYEDRDEEEDEENEDDVLMSAGKEMYLTCC